ncbi:hypothetical protein [Clostridium thermobutyricum]|uniref:Uncharacterized protein n=1 Tax=Clostridium thermobutyricum DSM 4928 TaxID=1121339 RepID=A0A1V4SVC6_9CLOT|nr:hypothetical protein [Clostridium thermobutyricum]OPX47929.1 hypothetical protein CLTHE_15000 [Clostridium thermobutyricum DSM 4928]
MNILIKELLDKQKKILKGEIDGYKKNIRVRDVKEGNDAKRVC